MEFDPHPLAHRWRFSPVRSLCSPRLVGAIAAFAEQGGTLEFSREGDGIPDNLKVESAMATRFQNQPPTLAAGQARETSPGVHLRQRLFPVISIQPSFQPLNPTGARAATPVRSSHDLLR